MKKEAIIKQFKLFTFGSAPGLGRWLSEDIKPLVIERLEKLSKEPLTKVQFNQLLVASHEASVSDGFFKYYWGSVYEHHPYNVESLEGWSQDLIKNNGDKYIISLDQLYWGLYRIYVDGLLYFGNVDAGFSSLRSMHYEEICAFFRAKGFDTNAIADRGPSLPLKQISRDDRYLISEMACKTFGEVPNDQAQALQLLQDAWEKHEAQGGKSIGFKELLMKYVTPGRNEEQILLSYDDAVSSNVDSKDSIKTQFDQVVKKFLQAREQAIANTELYLSMVNDLDVYVATSMRSRKNFRDMADACDKIFSSGGVKHLHLRHFDPTLSAARGHEDKGLIECLMVKCAKVLVYCEGEKESYGKDAEAAMALSLGKPVVFFCDHGKKTNFYRDVHPLARLIDFRTGVAVGAIVTDKVDQVSEMLRRIFENKMEYRLEHHASRPGYLKLIEKLTNSVVRLQTDDELIKKTFWNNYRRQTREELTSLAAGKEVERMSPTGTAW
jgi:hypothetical protein